MKRINADHFRINNKQQNIFECRRVDTKLVFAIEILAS